MEAHFRQLERMYQHAPINDWHQPRMHITSAACEIRQVISTKHHHAAGGTHGSVYFKLLDDAAYFAASSLENTYFLVTVQFSIQFIRPFGEGELVATGKVTAPGKTILYATSEIRDTRNKLIATGTGSFARSKTPLLEATGYQLPVDK